MTIWSGTRPITRTRPPAERSAKSPVEVGAARTVCLTHSGTGTLDLADGQAALQHELRLEALEIGQKQVGLVARRDRAEMREDDDAPFRDAITSASSGAIPCSTLARTIELM